MTNPDNVGGLPVFVSSDIERLLSDAYACGMNGDPFDMLNARRVIDKSVHAYAELCRAAPAGGDDQKDYEMDKTIYDLAIHCGAHVDGGEYPDHSANFAGSPPTIEFTDRQLEKFVEKLLDGSYAYAGFQK